VEGLRFILFPALAKGLRAMVKGESSRLILLEWSDKIITSWLFAFVSHIKKRYVIKTYLAVLTG
jgi:hypothetical protein